MSRLSGLSKILILAAILIVPSLWYMWLITGRNHYIRLPIFGEREVSASGDTVYHTIPSFSFVNQNGEPITDEYYKDKIYVADFFFATCQSICPKMTTQMTRIQEKFKAERNLKLASFTVNPENDSVPVLREYARQYMVKDSKWNLMTGKKEDIYKLGVNGYLVPAQEDALAPGGFLHSEYFILVDKEKRIRGFYDGTSKGAVDTLMDEIIVLMQEYK